MKIVPMVCSFLVLTNLTGCALAPVVVGGTAVTTATVVTDRRAAGTIVNDEVLEKRLQYEITQSFGKKDFHIDVVSYEGKVLLVGEVPTATMKSQAANIASVSPGVKKVVNELAVMQPSSMTTRLSDSMLATKIRTNIIATRAISLNQMKVNVQRGIVYLMGIVTVDRARKTVETVKNTSGVQKVVTVFQVETKASIQKRMKDVQNNVQH